jgi:hypothetical protein
MKYKVEKLSGNMCSIILVPEGRVEINLLTQLEQEDKFQEYYQEALSKHVDAGASFVEMVNAKHYPGHVIVKYEVSSEQ